MHSTRKRIKQGKCKAWCAASMSLIKAPMHPPSFPAYKLIKSSSLQHIHYLLNLIRINSLRSITIFIMSMQSTLRNQPYSILIPRTPSKYSQNLQSAFSTPSLLQANDATLPLSLSTGENSYEHNPSSLHTMYLPALGYEHSPAPTDGGETGWYCSYCGDGPYGSWQVSCQNCSSNK